MFDTMTCVLSMSHLYQSPCTGFTDDKTELNHNKCENFGFGWIAPAQHPSPGLGDSSARCSTSCRVEASSNTGSSSRMDSAAKGLSVHKKQDITIESIFEEDDSSKQNREAFTDTLTKSANMNGMVVDDNRRVCSLKQSVTSPDDTDLNDCRMHLGIKRKADTCDIDHIPTKRVSPFLNTPKERKDERKKVLKISLKKLRQLEDPEAFLRRTVLVNNTMKRMQSELREEKYRSRKFESNRRKSFNGYNVLNNNCLSNSYLYDDPFLCGINEKITDDMTETLINNVFHDKPCDDSAVPDVTDEDTSKQSAGQCSVEPNSRTCDAIAVQSDRCEHFVVPSMCELCKAQGSCNQRIVTTESLHIQSSNISVASTQCNSSDGEGMKCTQTDMECDKSLTGYDINPAGVDSVGAFSENKVETDPNKATSSVSDDFNVDISDLDVITDDTYESALYIDKKLDQKSMSHSFNTFMSTFDTNHVVTSALS